MALCPVCEHDNRVGVLICENCGSDLYVALLNSVSTRKLDPTGSTGELDASDQPVVFYIGTDTVAIERENDLIVGRIDLDHNEMRIDVDLGPYGGQDQGVSRRHVKLDALQNPPTITDLGSYNGTFVNGQKLVPDQPHPLLSGDELRFGRLAVRIYFK